jgi:hypothetical protein
MTHLTAFRPNNTRSRMTNQLLNDLITAFRQARSERDQARKEAEDLRDVMRIHIGEWPYTFSWEKEEKQ